MLHILWMIIKFILILLGAVLGFVLLLLLLVLFCPVRYHAALIKNADDSLKQITAKGGVSWLFQAISLKISYEKGQLSNDICLFGISLQKLWKKIKNRKKKKGRPKTKANAAVKPSSPKTAAVSRQENVPSDTKSENPVSPLLEADKGESRPDVLFEEDSFEEEIEDWINTEPKKVTKLPEKTRQKSDTDNRTEEKKESRFKKAFAKFDDIRGKIKEQKDFLSEKRVKEALSLVWSAAKGLICHILPTKAEGRITFGSEDPAITGSVLAILGMSFPLHKNRISVNPVFEDQNILEGKIQVKGRIYGCVLAKTAIQIYFNKNVKYIINRWRHKED